MPGTYRPPGDLYPFQSRWLDLEPRPGASDRPIRMHYLDEGPREAPPVLMVHGNPTWSFYYRRLVLTLRDRYRCIVPDHVGCGLSDKPGDDRYPYRLERRIADLDSLLRHLSLHRSEAPRISLVVHDWGGMIGFGWAAQAPERVARTVIMNTAAFPMPDEKRFPFLLWLAGRTGPGGFLVRSMNAFSGLAARIAFKKPVDPAVRAAYTGPYDSWDNRIATLRFVQDIPLEPGDPGWDMVTRTAGRLPAFAEKPALIGWGEKDFVFDAPFLRRWEEELPEAEVHRYPDCGHYVLEDAAPRLVPAIESFLDRHAAGGREP